jgi:hypothetical protein
MDEVNSIIGNEWMALLSRQAADMQQAARFDRYRSGYAPEC